MWARRNGGKRTRERLANKTLGCHPILHQTSTRRGYEALFQNRQTGYANFSFCAHFSCTSDFFPLNFDLRFASLSSEFGTSHQDKIPRESFVNSQGKDPRKVASGKTVNQNFIWSFPCLQRLVSHPHQKPTLSPNWWEEKITEGVNPGKDTKSHLLQYATQMVCLPAFTSHIPLLM